jgi:hypothetical protein
VFLVDVHTSTISGAPVCQIVDHSRSPFRQLNVPNPVWLVAIGGVAAIW